LYSTPLTAKCKNRTELAGNVATPTVAIPFVIIDTPPLPIDRWVLAMATKVVAPDPNIDVGIVAQQTIVRVN